MAERISSRRAAHLAILLLIAAFLLAACSNRIAIENPAANAAELETGDEATTAAPTATAEPPEPTQAPPTAVAATEAPSAAPTAENTPEETSQAPERARPANQNEFGRTDFLRDYVSDGQGLWPFVPLDNPEFLTADEAAYLAPNDLVLGLSINGEHKAYPTNLMWFHHVANDTVGGEPVAVTY